MFSISLQETERVYLTIDEVIKLYETDYTNLEIKRAFLFSCYTGLRLSDVKSLTWGQIREGKLFFKQKKTKGMAYLPLNQNCIGNDKSRNSTRYNFASRCESFLSIQEE